MHTHTYRGVPHPLLHPADMRGYTPILYGAGDGPVP